jgi:perosamine synthetase
MINIYQPNIEKYSESAIKSIKTGWISNHGEYVEKTNTLLKNTLNVKHCILMSNGTCATHCLFLALKYKHPEIQKIYVPNNCYVAAHNSVLMEYDKTQLVIMKMDMNTWNIDTSEEYITSLDTNSAVLIVHNLGNIVNVPRLKILRPDLIFVEDNCEGLFGKYGDVYSGMSESTLCSSASFYGNKIITSGEGGSFFTNDDDVYNHIKRVYSQGMSNVRYLHNIHAYNYRMTNVQAAFIYDQLNDLDSILQNKRRIFNKYKELLRNAIDDGKVKLFECEEGTESADWIFSVRLVGNQMTIEETTKFFNNKGVDIRPFFYPIHEHNHLSDIVVNDPVSLLLNKEIIMIPSSPMITEEEQNIVAYAIIAFMSIV